MRTHGPCVPTSYQRQKAKKLEANGFKQARKDAWPMRPQATNRMRYADARAVRPNKLSAITKQKKADKRL